jgi:hypothetical protein
MGARDWRYSRDTVEIGDGCWFVVRWLEGKLEIGGRENDAEE